MTQIQEILPPPTEGKAYLGNTITRLVKEASKSHPNPALLGLREEDGSWTTWSTETLMLETEEMAAYFRHEGFEAGDRIAFLMETDPYFNFADLACIRAGTVPVPIYLTHQDETVAHVVNHCGAQTLWVTDQALLERVGGFLSQMDGINRLIISRPTADTPATLGGIPVVTTDEMRGIGKVVLEKQPSIVADFEDAIEPDDLATIRYTAGTTGVPKGVMLSHENMTSNSLVCMHELGDFQPGATGERALVFLPLTHIFARAFQIAFWGFGASCYYCRPDQVKECLPEIRPTIWGSVPRVLEKVRARLLETAASETGIKGMLLRTAMTSAAEYSVAQGVPQNAGAKFRAAVAGKVVFPKIREALGGQTRYIICGGAALSAEVANFFGAAGVNILQGYGLSETSPVITFNRPSDNREGTVGWPIPGIEVALATDGEILTRGYHVMKGYYNDSERTREVIDDEGWFHTGDVGEIHGGHLVITDRKKDLFKLSTGKYVTPAPLETRLMDEALIEQAVVVGAETPFCSALIFPNVDFVRATMKQFEHFADEQIVAHETIIRMVQDCVDKANTGIDPWSTIKKFAVLHHMPTIDNGLLTPTLKIRRRNVYDVFAADIAALYAS